MIEELMPVILAMIAGGSYALYQFANKTIDPTSPVTADDINWYAVIATMLTGAFVGAIMFLNDSAVTYASIEIQLGVYMVLTIVLERGLRTLAHKFNFPWLGEPKVVKTEE